MKKFYIILALLVVIVIAAIVITKINKKVDYSNYFLSVKDYKTYEEYRSAVENQARKALAAGEFKHKGQWTDEERMKGVEKMADWLCDLVKNYPSVKGKNWTAATLLDECAGRINSNANNNRKKANLTGNYDNYYKFPTNPDKTIFISELKANGIYDFLALNAQECATLLG